MSWNAIGKYMVDYGVLGIIGYFFLKNATEQQQMVKNMFKNTLKENQKALADIQKDISKSETRVEILLKELKDIKIGFKGINESIVGLHTINNDNTLAIKQFLNEEKNYNKDEANSIIKGYMTSTILRAFIKIMFKVDEDNLTISQRNIASEIENIINKEVNKGRMRLKNINLDSNNLKKLFKFTEKLKKNSIKSIQAEFNETINNLKELEAEANNCGYSQKITQKIIFQYKDLKRRLWSIAEYQQGKIRDGIDKICV